MILSPDLLAFAISISMEENYGVRTFGIPILRKLRISLVN